MLLAFACTTVAQAASPRVLATSGVKIAGLGIATLEAPGAAADGSVLFHSASTSITIGGVSFATGDPLPAPFTGTIDEVMGGQVAGDLGAVLTSAGGPDLGAAIFAIDAGTVTPLVTFGPADPADPRTFVMNSRGDVVYLSRTPKGGELYARLRSSTTAEQIAGPSKTLWKPRALVIDENGAAAWVGRTGGVWYWDFERGTRQVSTSHLALRRAGGSPIAIDASFDLLFATRDALGKLSPADGTVTTIARPRDVVAGISVRRLYGDVSFLDDGTATGLVRARKPPTLRYLCLPPSGSPAPCTGGLGHVTAGTAVPAMRSSAIFRASVGGVAAVVRPGDVIAGVGTLADVSEHVVAGRTVAFHGRLDDDHDVLAWWRGGRITAAVADGARSGGLTLDVGSPLYDATASTALVDGSAVDANGAGTPNATSLLLVRSNGRVTAIQVPRQRRFANLIIERAVLAGRRVVVLSDEALLATRGNRLVPLVVPGGKGPHPFESLVDVAAGGSRVVLIANRDGADALFELGTAGPRLLAPLPTSYSLLGVDRGDVAVLASVSEDGGVTFVDELQLFGSAGAARTVARIGDPTTVGAIASIDAAALAGADVVISARMSGDGARHALLAIDRTP